ncbi:hypothetical protein CCP3SC1_220004 [Gammaproteobacteria bacterium]
MIHLNIHPAVQGEGWIADTTNFPDLLGHGPTKMKAILHLREQIRIRLVFPECLDGDCSRSAER